MTSVPGRHRFSPLQALGYLLSWPVMLLLGMYATLILGLNTRAGATAVGELLDWALPGQVEVAHLAIGPGLGRVEAFGVRFGDFEDRDTIVVRHATCHFRLGALLLWQVHFDACTAKDGRVLVHEESDGLFGIEKVFTGEFGEPGLAERPPLFRFSNVRIANVDVMINVWDAFFLVEGVTLEQVGFEITNRSFQLAVGEGELTGGRIVVSERLVGLGDGLPDWETVAWEAQRARDPWSVARAALPERVPGDRGLLELPIHAGSFAGFRWDDYWFSFQRGRFLVADMEIDASGRVRVIAERPKVPQRERAMVTVEGRARVALTPEGPLLEWALPGVIRSDPDMPEARGLEPLVLEGYGTVRFFEGDTRVEAEGLRILDWPVARLSADLSLHRGTVTLRDGARAELWGGEVVAGGRFTPRTGAWDLRMCAHNLHLAEAVAPWVGADADPELLRLLAGRLDAGAGADGCVGAAGAGAIEASGVLTLKALEVAPAATTPPDKVIQEPMIGLRARQLQLRWDQDPPWLPTRQLRLDVVAALDQRGVVALRGPEGTPGVQVRGAGARASLWADVDTVAGTFRDGRLQVDVEALQRWTAALGIDGVPSGVRVAVDGPFDGPWERPRFGETQVMAALAEAVGPVPALTVRGVASTTDRSLRLRALDVRSSAGRVSAEGELGLFAGSIWRLVPDPSMRWTAVVHDLALESVLVGLDVGGRVEGRVEGTGSLARPRIAAELASADLQVVGEPLDAVAAAVVLTPEEVVLERLHVERGTGTLASTGRLGMRDGQVSAGLEGCGWRLSEVAALDALEAGLDGDVCLALRVDGPADGPRVGGWVTADRLSVANRRLGRASIALDTFPCAAPWDGQPCIEWAGVIGGDLLVDGRLPMSRGPLMVSAHFAKVMLDRYVPELRGVVSDASVSGEALFAWDFRAGGAASAALALDALSFRVGEQAFETARTAVLTWRVAQGDGDRSEQQLLVEDLALVTEGRLVRADGALTDFDRLDFQVTGDVDLALLRMLPDYVVDAEGIAAVDVRVGGTVAAPTLAGQAAFDSARVAPRGLGTNVILGRGLLELTTDAILVSEEQPLRGTLFGGDFTVHGQVMLDRLLPAGADLQAFVSGLVYRIPNELVVTLLGDVRFLAPSFADAETWALSGDVEVLDARYFRNFDVFGDQFAIGEFRRPAQRFEPPIWQSVPELGALQLDLRVTGRDRFRVESRVASATLQLELQLDLLVRGRLREMEVLGEADIREGGVANYRGRRFEVERGVMTFDGYRDEDGYPMPILDVELRSSIRPCTRGRRDGLASSLELVSRDLGADENVLLTAFLDGRLPYGITFQLESTPFYDQRDLLSLVLTGCTLDELTAASAGGPTLDLVFRPVIDAVERNVEQRLDVDDVDIVPTTEGAAEITVRNEVTERLSWTLNARVGAEEGNVQALRIEYKLLDWLLLDLREQSGQDEGFTLDAGVRFRFRVD